jgi:transcription initiation factor TFIID TATA-box-binding protein
MDHERIEYEPEAFFGPVCRIPDLRVIFLLFSSGKISITGGKSLDEGKTGLDILMEKPLLLSINV